MRYYLSDGFVLKWLETPSVYYVKEDELYELDDDAFEFLKKSASEGAEAEYADKEFIGFCLSEGILTAKAINVKRPVITKSPTPSLRYLELQITDKCNLKCGHCYIGRPENNEISIDEIKAVLDEFEEMQGLRLLLTGGEPLMHSYFDEINLLLPEYNFRKILFTNGL
ncbi:MAG: radical SAM protein, partial [Nitrospiraceae bacterium]|nr:radical SAM protein [Nitrospiraceae bacterium]